MADSDQEASPCGGYSSELETEPLGNPTLPPDVDPDKLRGDRIGDTVFSGKWCIQTVMKLIQSNVVVRSDAADEAEEKAEDMEEELQNEVGALWDMTINVDVCRYLHSVGAVESICYVLTNSRSPRATEMCVGMLANMITHEELWTNLRSDSTICKILISLLTSMDQPVLIQVTRFFNTALCQSENSGWYSCLCENSSLVTQKIMRIFSGSTNADLLKQTAELTYMLMTLDEQEECFCALVADSDFISSLVEASKELGYDCETSGQSYIMQIFLHLTTYTAGILAIENVMEQMAKIMTLYLLTLCHNLHLSQDATSLTSIVATLNHVFCRDKMVRTDLLSSASFIHCVLKILVSVYRKLGCYSSIAYTQAHGQAHSSKAVSAWKKEEESSSDRKPPETASWSERATLVSSASNTYKTPEASPCRAANNKELEASWSERRMSSPLIDDIADKMWKKPDKIKRLKRREDSQKQEEEVCQEKTHEEQRDGASNNCTLENDVLHNKEIVNHNTDYLNYNMESMAQNYEIHGNTEGRALDVSTEGDSSLQASPISQGFVEVSSDLRESQMIDKPECPTSEGVVNQNGCEIFPATKEDVESNELITYDVTSKVCGDEMSSSLGETRNHGWSSLGSHTDSDRCVNITSDEGVMTDEGIRVETDEGIGMVTDDKLAGVSRVGSSDSRSDSIETLGTCEPMLPIGWSNEEDVGIDHNPDKYQKLLAVIQEFLTDYFQYFTQDTVTDEGRSGIKNIMNYFNSQCSSTEIRAMVKCVGASTEPTQPVGRLLHMSQVLSARRITNILTEFLHKES